MDRRLFGTDGIRGLANTHPMTAEVALALGKAAGRLFTRGGHRHRVVIGKDTRLSGYMIEPALTAGFVSAGMNVMLVGPMPTPAVAFLTRSLRADLGVMVSASHNPYHDNGIKLFGPDGFKLSDEIEDEIEAHDQARARPRGSPHRPISAARSRIDDARGRYIENLKSSFPRGLTLTGLKLVVDSAHGAAYHLAADLFFELGAEVVRLGTEPNGLNINAGCGSNEPVLLRDTVLREQAHLGIALDGDADRLVLVDDRGNLVDGDQLLGLIAASWHADHRMRGDGVVATVMSNLGLERYLAGAASRCTAPGSATATWSSGCGRTATMSAASSRAISSCRTSPPPATASWRRCRCWRCCASATGRPARSHGCSSRFRNGCATSRCAAASTWARPRSPVWWLVRKRVWTGPAASWCAPPAPSR